jgi:hypothetical protein
VDVITSSRGTSSKEYNLAKFDKTGKEDITQTNPCP